MSLLISSPLPVSTPRLRQRPTPPPTDVLRLSPTLESPVDVLDWVLAVARKIRALLSRAQSLVGGVDASFLKSHDALEGAAHLCDAVEETERLVFGLEAFRSAKRWAETAKVDAEGDNSEVGRWAEVGNRIVNIAVAASEMEFLFSSRETRIKRETLETPTDDASSFGDDVKLDPALSSPQAPDLVENERRIAGREARTLSRGRDGGLDGYTTDSTNPWPVDDDDDNTLPFNALVCDLCGEIFASDDAFQSHRKSSHLGELKTRRGKARRVRKGTVRRAKSASNAAVDTGEAAAAAEAAAEEKDGESDSKTEEDPEKTCQFCGKKFHKGTYVLEHIKRVHEKRPPTHPCDICGRKYASNQGLLIHKEVMHDVRRQRKPTKDSSSASSASSALLDGDFRCAPCGKVFKHRMSYSSHVNRFHSANPPAYYRNLKFVCPFCGEERSGKYGLQKHIETVHELKKHSKCHICGKEFSKKRSAQEHIDSVHFKLKKHSCGICGAVFGTNRNRDSHVQLVHLNIRKHKCETCAHSFSRKKQLEVHVKNVHQGRGATVGMAEGAAVRCGRKEKRIDPRPVPEAKSLELPLSLDASAAISVKTAAAAANSVTTAATVAANGVMTLLPLGSTLETKNL